MTARRRLLKSHGHNKHLKRRRAMMAVCTFGARAFAPRACIEDLMTEARKIKFDVIETGRHRLQRFFFETGEEQRTRSLEYAVADGMMSLPMHSWSSIQRKGEQA
ncbi:unnamed protein product [Haemonchus placei]|uniref:DUF1273 family protein n=1 Tax=Haemonchus placei TaxID=6290 RepID=A0A0N4WNZ1_HAEPC|nr:unnamed protein product [Haemonchus placei]